MREKLEDSGKALAASRREIRALEERTDVLEKEKNETGAELALLRKAKRDLEDRIANLDDVRVREDERYRALLSDYDTIAGKKSDAQRRINTLEEALGEKDLIVQNLKSVNAELKNEVARSRAPKFQPTKSQSADAENAQNRAASPAGSPASSRSERCSSLGSKRGKRSANT